MSQYDHGPGLLERTPLSGHLRWALTVGGLALTVFGLAAFAGLRPGEQTPVRFGAFVVLPLAMMASLVYSTGIRRRPLFVLVGLLDVEAVLLAEVPVRGMASAIVVPLVGVGLVTYLLPAERLVAPYVAAWVSGTVGVAWSFAVASVPSTEAMPLFTIVPTFAIIDAAALMLLWELNRRRSAALHAVAEAEARLSGLLEGVELFALDTDAAGNVAFMNAFALQLTGWERDEIIGRDWYETFVPEERRAEAVARLARLRTSQEAMPSPRESWVMTRSGERRLLHWSHVTRRDEHGRYLGVASIGEDVTAARATEAAIRRATELNQTLIVSSPLPTAIIGLDRTVQLWNPAVTQLLGWSEAEVVGKPVPDLVPADSDRRDFPGILSAAAVGTAIRGVPLRLRRRDGSTVNVHMYATALRNDEGDAVAVAAQAVDLTALHAMEEKLREAQKMEAVGRLAGGVAHDFNNSLTAIGGFAALIAASTDDPEIREEAESISAAVRRAGNLTRELLAYARRSLLQPEAIEVNTLVGAVRPMLRRLLGEDVQVVIESGVNEAMVRVDPGQLEQAILNLAVNARDAMPDGGRLTIRTGRRVGVGSEPPIGGSAGRADGDGRRPAPVARSRAHDDAIVSREHSPTWWVVISVTDTGSGIPLELQSQVFDPFFTTKPVGAGTGLGLAMVQGFVAQSGGRVDLQSQPGAGTTVEIVLPEVTGHAPRASAADEPVASAGGGETILFVEDEPAVAAVGFQVLSRRGYRVLLADTGATAKAILEAHDGPIALLLLDVILPDIRGPQVAEAAKASHPEAAVLYASGYAADAFVRRSENDSQIDLIEKPYSPEQLALRVRAGIERHRGAVAAVAGPETAPAAGAGLDADGVAGTVSLGPTGTGSAVRG